MERYVHRQYSPLMSILLVLLVAANMSAGWTDGYSRIVAVVILVFMATFALLTTQVDERGVRWAFTFGVPSGRIALEQIESVAVTQTNWLEGWGLHWTIWHGWLWNVSGFQAVEIHYGGGKRVTLGTDEPHALCAAIERMRGSMNAAPHP